MKRLGVALALAAALAGPAAAAPADAAAWPLASGYSAQTFHTVNLRQFAQDVRDATRGQLVLEVHADSSLVRLADIRAAVEEGRVPAGEVIMTSLDDVIPAAGADAIPFIVDSYQDARALWRAQRPSVEKALARRGLTALYAVPWPSQGLYTARPITRLTDLQGASMRTYNATTARIAQLVGAHGVDVPASALPQALADGRIDAMITSGVTGVDNRAWEHLKYFYDIHAWYPKNLVVANKARFDALPEAVRNAVRSAAAVAEERGWRMSEQASTAALAELASHGMQVEKPGFALRDDLHRYGEKFAVEWVRTAGNDASAVLIPYYTAGNAASAAGH